jgi:hypothetical protein
VAVFVGGCQLNIPALVNLLRWHFPFFELDIIQIELRACVCVGGFALACAYEN